MRQRSLHSKLRRSEAWANAVLVTGGGPTSLWNSGSMHTYSFRYLNEKSGRLKSKQVYTGGESTSIR